MSTSRLITIETVITITIIYLKKIIITDKSTQKSGVIKAVIKNDKKVIKNYHSFIKFQLFPLIIFNMIRYVKLK